MAKPEPLKGDANVHTSLDLGVDGYRRGHHGVRIVLFGIRVHGLLGDSEPVQWGREERDKGMTDATRPPNAPRFVDYFYCDAADDTDWARSRFLERYGHEPRVVWSDERYLYLGPIEKGE